MESPPEKASHESAAAGLLAREQLRERLEALVLLLPERDRLPLQLHYFHGLSQTEIADALGFDKSTVSRRIARALRQLERMMRRAGLDESTLAMGALGGAVGAAALMEPPAALGAGVIFAKAQAALATGAASGAGHLLSPSTLKTSYGAVIVKTKVAIVTALLALGVGGLIFYGAQHLSGKAASRSAEVAARQTSGAADAATGRAQGGPVPAANASLKLDKGRQGTPSANASTKEGPAARAKAPSGADTTQTLTVHVVWRDGHKPVAQAGITLAGPPRERKADSRPVELKAQTSAQGEAQIPYPGWWTMARLEVNHPKGGIHQGLLNLPMTKTLEVELTAGGRLYGTVWLESKGEPAAGAEVAVFDVNSAMPIRRALRKATTDKMGGFSIDQVPAGSFQLIATRDALSSALKESELKPITLDAGEASGPHDLVLRGGNTLMGIVRDQVTQKPIAGAVVQSLDIYSGSPKATSLFKERMAQSDVKGAYKLEGLPLEDLDIVASAEGYAGERQKLHPGEGVNFHDFALEPGTQVEALVGDRIMLSRRVHLNAGEAQQANLVGDFGALVLEGRVMDPAGAPRKGWFVGLTPSFPTAYTTFSCRTDMDGRYRIEGLAAGEYIARINPPGNGPAPPQPKSEPIRIPGNMTKDFSY